MHTTRYFSFNATNTSLEKSFKFSFAIHIVPKDKVQALKEELDKLCE